MTNNFRHINFEFKKSLNRVLNAFLFLVSIYSYSQITASVDSATVNIGAQITYKIELKTDTINSVIFPEGQSFTPLEMIESYQTDTVVSKGKYLLTKSYGLTQFEPGQYVVPQQKIVIAGQQYKTDSLLVKVNTIAVDTSKQKMFDIKPMVAVEKPASDWWKYLLLGLLALSIIGFLLYWFIWRKKPLSEEEQIALLPPYDRAKLALEKLDATDYLAQSNYKAYYSELTLAIRKYLDEKVYSQALESTTDQLVAKLKVLSQGEKIDLSKEDIKEIEAVLKRADLVKFANSAPEIELAKRDRTVIAKEIDNVKEALPEPTEEEKLLNLRYKKEQEKKAYQKKITAIIAATLLVIGLAFAMFCFKYGFTYVVDTIFQKETKQLLEGEWVASDYGFPPITLSTPEVLKRQESVIPDELKDKVKRSLFSYELDHKFTIVASSALFSKQQKGPNDVAPEDKALKTIEDNIKYLESKGARNIINANSEFITPNKAQGVKTSGTFEFPVDKAKTDYVEGQFVILTFAAEEVLQQLFITYLKDDIYLDQVVERIEASIELTQKED